MKIIVDGMGGDNAPQEIVKGTIRAAKELAVSEPDVTVSIIGPEELIGNCLKENGWNGSNIEVIDATEVITNDEAPAMAVRRKKDSTIVKALNLIKKGEADALISAGSTGALLAGGLVTLGRIKGIRRPAIAAWFPKLHNGGTTLLLDCGANVEAKPEYIFQNGIMGAMYVEGVKGIKNPEVRLLNIGAEETKGDELHKEAHRLLASGSINFTGNIEGRDVAVTDCEVVITDGFSGNVFLKSSEGAVLAVMNRFKEKLQEGLKAKLGALLAYSKIKELKQIAQSYCQPDGEDDDELDRITSILLGKSDDYDDDDDDDDDDFDF
jgi:glycerol-3-phosphate acyltransferase PlsX